MRLPLIHLSTALVVLFLAGALSWLNTHETKRDATITVPPPILIGPTSSPDKPSLSASITSMSPLQAPMVVTAWGWPFDAAEKMEVGTLHPDYAANKPAIENSYPHGLKWNPLKAAGDCAVFVLVLIGAAVVLENRIRRRRARMVGASAGLMARMMRGTKKKAEGG
ncbi:MAG TPA: hypothetical protein VKX17_02020 [Planctomycetota bacterium]|nr:hypothetical protein [Planctomycetota bacterium]